MSKIPYKTFSYKRKYNRQQFSSGKAALDNYILRNVAKDVKSGASTCFVLLHENQDVFGYYTLSTESIPKDDVPDEMMKSFSHDRIPVILLSRLAVDKSLQGQGYGKFLLIEALKKSSRVAKEHIGAVAVVVDPIDEEAVAYYAKYGFTYLPDSGRMFMTMRKIESAFSLC